MFRKGPDKRHEFAFDLPSVSPKAHRLALFLKVHVHNMTNLLINPETSALLRNLHGNSDL